MARQQRLIGRDKNREKQFQNAQKYREQMNYVFEGSDSIDPSALSLGIQTPDRQPPSHTAMLKRLPKHADRHYVFDIETWGSDPSRLDFAAMCDMEGNTIEHNGSDIIETWDDVFEAIENLIPNGNNPETGRGWFIKVWAHNGAKFDYAGLAKMITSNVSSTTRTVQIPDPNGLERRKQDIARHIKHLSDFMLRDQIAEVLNLDSNEAITDALIEIANKYRHDFYEYEQVMALASAQYTIEVDKIVPEQGVFRGAREIVRRRGKHTYKWSFVPMGHTSYIKVSRGTGKGYSELRLVDSLQIINSRLDDMGEKGITPFRNINPNRWLIEEWLCGNLKYDPRFFEQQAHAYWKASRNEQDEEYCRQDVRILARALSDLQHVFRTLIPDHPDLATIDALDYNTITQMSASLRNIMFVHDQREPIMRRKNPHQIYCRTQGYDATGHRIGSLQPGIVKQDSESVDNLILSIKQKIERGMNIDYKIWDYPVYNPNIQNFYSFPVFYQNGASLYAYNRCTYGGSTTVYQPNTPPGYRVMRFDIINMYGSIQALSEFPFVYPEKLRSVKELGFRQGITGKHNILNIINDRNGKPKLGGVVEVKINRLICNGDVNFHKFPLIPGHMNAVEFHEQTVFADHDDRYRRVILVEELRYILENADVAHDDVTILPDNSYLSPYMPYKPTAHFINKIFNIRKKAKDAGEEFKSKLYKMIQNASFGEMLQTITNTIDLNSSNPEGIIEAIDELKMHNPYWPKWEEVENAIGNKPQLLPDHPDYENAIIKYSINLMQYIRAFLTDNWIDIDPQVFVDDREDNRLVFRMTSGISMEAIKAWGAAIPGFGRIVLHKGCVAANRAGFEVAYTDTDCVDALVPISVSDEEAIRRLKAAGMNIGTDIGQWEYQPFEAAPEMLVSGADVKMDGDKAIINNPRVIYLASKHYAIYDKYMNCLKVVVKGIQSENFKQRSLASAIILSRYNAKNRRGLSEVVNQLHYSDNLENIHRFPKRNYPGMYEMSTPIMLTKVEPEQVQARRLRKVVLKGKNRSTVESNEGHLIPTWDDYIRTVNTIHADNTGLIEARDFYCNQLYFKRKRYHDLKAEIETVKETYSQLKTHAYLKNITADDFNTEIKRIFEFKRGYEPSTDEVINSIKAIYQDV